MCGGGGGLEIVFVMDFLLHRWVMAGANAKTGGHMGNRRVKGL